MDISNISNIHRLYDMKGGTRMPDNNNCMRLCGGTFFTLILRTVDASSNQELSTTTIEGRNEPNCMKDLIKVFFPSSTTSSANTLKTNTRKYKKCEINGGAGIPFNDSIQLNKFDSEIKQFYSKCLHRMNQFAGKYINPGKREWLVKALIEIILDDENIDNSQEFYILENGKTVKKADINKLDSVNLSAFLLGVYHYSIVVNKDNTVGKDTYKGWFSKKNKSSSEYIWISSIGESTEKHVNVDINEITIPYEDGGQNATKENPFDVTSYFAQLQKDYKGVKNLLFDHGECDFDSFFVCNSIRRRICVTSEGNNVYSYEVINDIDVGFLEKEHENIVLTAQAGSGKSMMLQHLLLDSMKQYSVIHRLPIIIPLLDYDESKPEIREYIFGHLKDYNSNISEGQYGEMLAQGRLLILFDGLDEIKSSYRGQFETKLNEFSRSYSDNIIVVSARPYSSFIHLKRFERYELLPFTKEQALELAKKLPYRDDKPGFKDDFIKELDTRLYTMHKDFVENPLLLTIMMMTYESINDVPTQIHKFYERAYSVLSQEHDQTKPNHFKRPLSTGLDPDRFEEYFAEFCANSYTQEESIFDNSRMNEYFSEAKKNIGSEEEQYIAVKDFIEDLTINLCLMFKKEDGKYYFTHDSFQEYFCAKFFASQLEDELPGIGQYFEETKRDIGRTFDMLYGMKKAAVNKFIILPFLEEIFKADESIA